MYQFYYADKAAPFVKPEYKENIRDHFQITALRPAMWEEHCLECSAPACFESCVHYQARSDGRCKRFVNGLRTFDEPRACCGQGVHVKFRQWGNMMSILFPAMLSEEDYRKLWAKNEDLGKLLGAIESSPLPRSLRWQGIRIPEFLRRRSLRKLSGLENTADAFVFHGYSYHSADYRLIVEVYDDHTPVYKTAIAIRPGENLSVIRNLSAECSKANNLVKIYPENNLEAELDILWCDFVQGVPVCADAPAEKVKCVVWDLDNTLWNGTLIETEDPATLSLNAGVQEVMRELDSRGILQSIASKNDYDPAMAVLKHLGIQEYFLYPQIHWQAKSGSMEQIARCLNIGIDSLVLIDDTAFERHQVSSVWPQVRTYDVTELDGLLDREEFQVPVTEESRSRRAMYRAEEQRTRMMQTQYADITEFLKQCNLRVRMFEPASEEEILRCYELAVRTNQLNMTGRKYTRAEFDEVLARADHKNFAFSCADDFGEYGIVGFGQYYLEEDTIVFSEFAMSCRVAGKFVESAVFVHLLHTENCDAGRFEVIKTKKNILLRNTLEQIGFQLAQDHADHASYTFTDSLTHCALVSVL